ncbi:hypothetical protein FNQ90_16670 [Streptomyces alkaliphilus]|uniref:Uncharacterized protein n=1 Tax=Streptomyces alkaliphilus TaxID=1472722 RepID=A0A7W3TF54_9ACTN|nr:hypothetical protein [Streptomyces alkaliphilus]MBB0245691.1 hypothetical protein [Streptomyces alkaliphilus]
MTIDRAFPLPRAGGLRILRGGSPSCGARRDGTDRHAAPAPLRVVPAVPPDERATGTRTPSPFPGTGRPDPDHDPEPDGRGPAGAVVPRPVAGWGVTVVSLVTARAA